MNTSLKNTGFGPPTCEISEKGVEMKVKTQNLTGMALDWAVAKCEWVPRTFEAMTVDEIALDCYYSTDWAQGGPIIEREGMTVGRQIDPTQWAAEAFDARGTTTFVGYGPTPLIAAMRCYVASCAGDEIEVPEELLKD